MKITVCTLAIGDMYKTAVKYSIINMKNYCKIHGYDYYDDESMFDGLRPACWYKIKLLEKVLSTTDTDYAIWIDADTHILNMDKKLESFIETHITNEHILVAKEGRSNTILNTGVMFVKNTSKSLEILSDIWNNKGDFDPDFHEQASFCNLWEKSDIKDYVKILPPWHQNEFLTYWFMYYPDSCFILHLTRCSNNMERFFAMMDLFCPVKMDEEGQTEYEERVKWLKSTEESRNDIDKWLQGGGRHFISKRFHASQV